MTNPRLGLLAIGTAAMLLALTACGGSSLPAPAATTVSVATPAGPAGAATSTGQPDFSAYRDCMATNGVTLPDMGTPPSGMPAALPSGMPTALPSGAGGGPGGFPGGLPTGVDQATFDAAQAACASLQPRGGPGAGTGAVDATALAAFTSCLADHDVTVPSGTDPMQGLDRTDPTVKAAMDVCDPLLPAPTPSS